MEKLVNLPTELILIIAYYLDELADLNSFLRVNRCLYNTLIVPFLLRETNSETIVTALFYAAAYGNEASIRLLLRKSRVKVYKSDWSRVYYQGPGEPSQEVVNFVQTKRLRLRLGHPNCTCGAHGPYEPLHWAIHVRSHRMAEMVLNYGRGTCVDARDKGGRTALYRAAQLGDVEMTKILLNHGAKLNGKRGEDTALQVAANGDYKAVAKILLKREAGLEKCVSWARKSNGDYTRSGRFSPSVPGPIYLATKYLDEPLVMLWLKGEKGKGSILSPDDKGRNALHIAARSRTAAGTAIIKLLLEHLPKPTNTWQYKKTSEKLIMDGNGKSPLHYAASVGHDSVEPLLEAGVYVDQRDNYWRTPLHHHLKTVTYSSAVVEQLLNYGADIKAKDFNGETPIHYATWNIQIPESAVSQLIDYGDNSIIETQNNKGRTALHLAAKSGSLKKIQVLLRCGSDIAAKDKRGNTPLDLAQRSGYLEAFLRVLFGGY